MKNGVVLMNIGTPASTDPKDVGRYLKEFLMDPYVVSVPYPIRWALIHWLIVPKRKFESAEAYESIWMPEGSPLLVLSERLRRKANEALGEGWQVELGMRYARPSIPEAMERLQECERIFLVPVYPQYAESTTRSSLEAAEEWKARTGWKGELVSVGAFYDNPVFIQHYVDQIRKELDGADYDHFLFSYHGLPESYLKKIDPTRKHCLKREDCCQVEVPANRLCYRHHSVVTTRLMAEGLGLPPEKYSFSFQSRLGPIPWIRPYTDQHIDVLLERGIKRLCVLTPSFVVDCIETLEEIGIRLREQFEEGGGEEFRLLSCLNEHFATPLKALLDQAGASAQPTAETAVQESPERPVTR